MNKLAKAAGPQTGLEIWARAVWAERRENPSDAEILAACQFSVSGGVGIITAPDEQTAQKMRERYQTRLPCVIAKADRSKPAQVKALRLVIASDEVARRSQGG